jgi:hypothetical protein
MKKLFTILFVLITFLGKSQDFEYQGLFEGIGDNREYFNNYGFPQTILGTRAAFEAGFKSKTTELAEVSVICLNLAATLTLKSQN